MATRPGESILRYNQRLQGLDCLGFVARLLQVSKDSGNCQTYDHGKHAEEDKKFV